MYRNDIDFSCGPNEVALVTYIRGVDEIYTIGDERYNNIYILDITYPSKSSANVPAYYTAAAAHATAEAAAQYKLQMEHQQPMASIQVQVQTQGDGQDQLDGPTNMKS